MRDLAGHQFGRLLVLHQPPRRVDGRLVWACQCTCGNRIAVPADNLRAPGKGGVKSCGCLLAEHRQRFVAQQQRHTTIQRTVFRRRNQARRAAKALVAAVRPVPEAGETA